MLKHIEQCLIKALGINKREIKILYPHEIEKNHLIVIKYFINFPNNSGYFRPRKNGINEL